MNRIFFFKFCIIPYNLVLAKSGINFLRKLIKVFPQTSWNKNYNLDKIFTARMSKVQIFYWLHCYQSVFSQHNCMVNIKKLQIKYMHYLLP